MYRILYSESGRLFCTEYCTGGGPRPGIHTIEYCTGDQLYILLCTENCTGDQVDILFCTDLYCTGDQIDTIMYKQLCGGPGTLLCKNIVPGTRYRLLCTEYCKSY